MSISQNFPDEGPSLNLNFASSRILDPRITFTRTSTGTYTDKNGLVTIASANTPRFDHSYNGSNVQSLGLLIEEIRTNLTTYSEDFTNAAWVLFGTTSRSANTVTAPDGNTTADTVTLPINSGIYQFTSASASTTYTFSVWIRTASASQNVNIVLNTNLGDATELTVTATTTWQRFSVTKTTSVGTTTLTSQLSTGGGNTFYVWGAQTEAGAFPTSYIPTVASTVTRSADNASMTGTNFTSWYNSSEGTLGFIGDTVSPSSYSAVYQIDNGDSNNRLYLDKVSSTRVVSTVSGSNQCLITLSTISSNTLFKLYGAYKLNDCAGSFNGGTVGTDTSATMPTCNMSRIGTDGVNYINGRVAQLSYYPKRLTNSQLQNLTK